MSYGDPRWQEWVLPEEEAIKHIKYAYVEWYSAAYMHLKPFSCPRYDHGITTFDTANVSVRYGVFVTFFAKHPAGLLSRSIRNHPRERYQETQPTARRARYPHQGAHICAPLRRIHALFCNIGPPPCCQGWRETHRGEPGRFRDHQPARTESQGAPGRLMLGSRAR